jgi:hypothetical protein
MTTYIKDSDIIMGTLSAEAIFEHCALHMLEANDGTEHANIMDTGQEAQAKFFFIKGTIRPD